MALPPPFDALGPEFAIVAACCRPLWQAERSTAIARAADAPFDARHLVALARAHRVEGFVEQGLRSAQVALLEDVALQLSAGAAEARVLMLRNAAEELRLTDALGSAGVDAVFVKGASLAMLAHGTLATKTSWDIDVLVAPAALDAARCVLEDQGYRFASFDTDDQTLIRRVMAATHETVWQHAERGTYVELHKGLTQTPAMLPGVGIDCPRQQVAVTTDGRSLPTLATPPLLAFLAVHGAVHGWARLKWLTDFAAFAARTDERMIDAAVHSATARSLALAARLSHDLLGTGAAPPLVHRTLFDHAALQIAKTARLLDSAPTGWREKTAFYRAGLALRPGLAPKWAYARSKFAIASTARRAGLPAWLRPVDMLAVGVPTAVMRGMRESFKRSRAA